VFALLLILSRLFAPGSSWCEEAQAAVRRAAPQPVWIAGEGPVRGVASIGETVIALRGEGRERQLVRSNAGQGETLASTSLRGAIGQESIVVNGDRWWYGSTGDTEDGVATTFVAGDGSDPAAITRVPVTGRGPYVFLPLRGPEPGGLQLTALGPQNTRVTEVDASGAQQSWQVPRIDLLNAHAIAGRLSGGRVALFVARTASLELLLLDKTGEVTTTTVRDSAPFQFATATDDAGRLAIVTATPAPGGERLEGAILDPDDAAAATWVLLTTAARLASWPAQELRLVATSEGFVAAWIDRSIPRRLELQACDLKTDGTSVIVANIGDPTEPRGFGADFSIQPAGHALTFFWDDGRHYVTRRIPASIQQFAATEAFARFCEAGR